MREYRFTLATLFATFFLLLVGGLVNPTGSSLACPDWPLCYGQFFPEMKGGVLYEHSHRLAAFTVGCLTIVMTVLILRNRTEPGLRRLTKLAIPLVVFQGVLGGVTVMLKLPLLVTLLHLIDALLFFALLITLAWLLRPREEAASLEASAPMSGSAGPGLRRGWIGLATLAVLIQVLLGGIVRHTKSASACRDLPFCQGSLWPVDLHPSARLHMLHRIVGVLVALLVIAVAVQVVRRTRPGALLRRIAVAVPLVALAQVTLGVLNVWLGLPLWMVTAHLGGAALLFGLHVWMWLAADPAPTLAATAASRDRAQARELAAGAPARGEIA